MESGPRRRADSLLDEDESVQTATAEAIGKLGGHAVVPDVLASIELLLGSANPRWVSKGPKTHQGCTDRSSHQNLPVAVYHPRNATPRQIPRQHSRQETISQSKMPQTRERSRGAGQHCRLGDLSSILFGLPTGGLAGFLL